jgi:hypothetical protein
MSLIVNIPRLGSGAVVGQRRLINNARDNRAFLRLAALSSSIFAAPRIDTPWSR